MNSLVILVAFEARAIMKRRLKWINNSCHIFKFWQTILQKKKVTWKKKKHDHLNYFLKTKYWNTKDAF